MRKSSICFVILLVSSSLFATENPNVIFKKEPVYPIEAYEKKIEGWVLLEFDITKLGVPNNIKAIKSAPTKIFDEAAINALKQWRFNPVFYSQPRSISDFSVVIEFKLDEANKNGS